MMEIEMADEKKVYQAIVWHKDREQLGERTTVLANSLEDAERKLKDRYGESIVFSLYSEEDADAPR
jgi:hypothetical protein